MSFSYSLQGSEFLKPAEPSANFGVRDVSTMPAPKKLVQPSFSGMPSPGPRIMPPPLPPPLPKFTLSTHAIKGDDKNNILNKTKSDSVPGKNRNLTCFVFTASV